jgi:glyoxylase-like metal-dependent hydrolase (beta-lactamase superfamily II)
MNDALRPGEVVTLAPGVRRLLAPNPGMMTGPGTNTYLLGETQIAVLDPGPRIDAHIDAIRAAAAAPIRWILVTHTHPDHSPAALPLAQVAGAELLGREPPPRTRQDPTFSPDRLLNDGDRLECADFSLRALHTPGHASDHLCYLHEQHQWLFTGDHVMNGSTVVIDPPDGNMNEYLRSLERLRALGLECLAPGHGDVLGDPDAVVDWIIAHRLEREAKVVRALQADPRGTLAALLPFVYDDVDPRLLPVAERSLLAHLIKLREDGRARQVGERWQLRAES